MSTELSATSQSNRTVLDTFTPRDTHSIAGDAKPHEMRHFSGAAEQLTAQSTPLDKLLAQPSLAQQLGVEEDQTGGKLSVADASSTASSSEKKTPQGSPISEKEYALLKQGDFIGFWRSRYLAGDPVAKTALTGWGDPDFVGASLCERYAAGHTWDDLSSYIKDNNLPVTMKQIGLELAKAHAQAVMKDDQNVHHLLSPHQVAKYHHDVFAKHGIPAHLFGGTHLIGGHWYLPDLQAPVPGGWATMRFDADTYSGLWCKGCDTKP